MPNLPSSLVSACATTKSFAPLFNPVNGEFGVTEARFERSWSSAASVALSRLMRRRAHPSKLPTRIVSA
jgi:hypothetical protein